MRFQVRRMARLVAKNDRFHLGIFGPACRPKRVGRDALEGGGGTPPPPERPAYAQPLSPRRQVPGSMALVTDSNRPEPLWQPPPTACLTASGSASGAPSLLLHPWGWVNECSPVACTPASRRGLFVEADSCTPFSPFQSCTHSTKLHTTAATGSSDA